MPKLAGRARCYCGSGKAYKDCHMAEDKAREEEQQACAERAKPEIGARHGHLPCIGTTARAGGTTRGVR